MNINNNISPRILIVENEMIIALGIKNILNNHGFNVLGIVRKGHDCLRKLADEKADVVLMDIKLDDDMDGIETADLVRKNFDIPVIFITAHSDDSSQERVIPTEHYGYILKPVNEKELLTIVQTTLYRHDIDKKIKKSEMKFRVLFNQSRDAIYVCHMNKKIYDVNLSMINLFGYSKDEYDNFDFYSLFKNRDDADNIFFILDEHGFIDNYTTSLVRKDRKEIYCQISSTVFYDDSGIPSGVQGIIKDITIQKKMEIEREYLLNNLAKRVKELNCLYILSEIIDKPGIKFSDILSEMLEVIKMGWQHPEITCVRISFKDVVYASKNFKETSWKQSVCILVDGENTGLIEVFYIEEMPYIYDGPFHKEEMDLLVDISERLGGIAERFKAEENLIKSRDELRNLTKNLQSIREDERTRISREIHDELGQSMTAIKMDLAWMVKQFSNDQGELRDKTGQIMNIINSTIQTVRRISSDLRPGILDDLGLSAAIEWQIRELKNRTNIDFEIFCDNCDEKMNDEQKVMFFRIFQEALTNIIRHSKAENVKINMEKIGNNINLKISDNGVGISDEQIAYSNSCGIIGMRERANSCGGIITINGKKNEGTVVLVSLMVN